MFSLFRTRKLDKKQDNINQYERIKTFLMGTGVHSHGRTYDQIIRYTNEQLEHSHVFIQWVFPTENQSMFNVSAPTVTREQAVELSKCATVKGNLHGMFIRMLLFYGIQLIGNIDLDEMRKDSFVVIMRGQRASWIFDKVRVNEWLQKGNHNLLRISRILESLRLFEMKEDYALLCQVVNALAEYKPELKTWSCWRYWTEYM